MSAGFAFWLLISVCVLNAVGTVYMIDKPRDRLSPNFAIVSLILIGLQVWAITTLGALR